MISELPDEYLYVINSILDNKNCNGFKYMEAMDSENYFMSVEHYARGLHINGEQVDTKGLVRIALLNYNDRRHICFFFNVNGTLLSLQLSDEGSCRNAPTIFYDVKNWRMEYYRDEVQYSTDFLFNLSITHPEIVDDLEYVYNRILGIKKDTQ